MLEELEDEGPAEDALADDEAASAEAPEEERTNRTRTQGYVETFFATSGVPGRSGYTGVNFAVATPVNRQVQMIFAGQVGEFERLEATARIRAGARHRLSATLGGARLPTFGRAAEETPAVKLGFGRPGADKLQQVSVRAIDEWIVRDGVVVVVGLDYSRFMGAGGDSSLTPRFGVAFDAERADAPARLVCAGRRLARARRRHRVRGRPGRLQGESGAGRRRHRRAGRAGAQPPA